MLESIIKDYLLRTNMEFNFLEGLKTKNINFDNSENFHYVKRSISAPEIRSLETFIKIDISNFKEFKNFFAYSGDLYLRGLISFTKTLILPFTEEEFNDITLRGYFATKDEPPFIHISENKAKEQIYLAKRQDRFLDYGKINHFNDLKKIEKDVLNCLEIKKPFKLKLLEQLYDFIFNNKFIDPFVFNRHQEINFKDIFEDLKDKLTSGLIYLEYLSKNKTLENFNINIGYIPRRLNYLPSYVNTSKETYTINLLFTDLKEYSKKIRFDFVSENTSREIVFKYTFQDLNFDTILFLELIQNIANKVSVGYCDKCGNLYVKSKRQEQERWKRNYCSKECRNQFKNSISNKNKKERLKNDPQYRKERNEKQAAYMRTYRNKKGN